MNIIPTSKRAAFKVTTGVMSCFILPQNGVVGGSVHYDSATQIAMGSPKDSHSGNVVSSDTPQRPKNLGVNSTNGYATKNLRDNSEDIDDGSFPCTPESQSDSENNVPSCPAGDEVLESDTRHLISRVMRDATGLSKSQWNESRALATMKRVVEDILDKHRYAYNGMINKLSLDDRRDDASFVSAVAKSLFADGTTNWGRVASLVAFGVVVCQYLKEKGREDCVELVGQEISTYLLTDQRDWLVKNNAWDGFVEFFRVADPESTVRNTLMAFAGFAGIGATLALLIRTNTTLIKVFEEMGVESLHGDDPQQTSHVLLQLMMFAAATLVTLVTLTVKNRLLLSGELRLRQFSRAGCTIHKWD